MTKFYTSYFSNYRKFPENAKLFSIAQYTPKTKTPIEPLIELAPSKQLLHAMKDGLISEEQFTQEYVKQLNKLCKLPNLLSYCSQYDIVVFLCYEKPSDFCHRHILADYLKTHYNIELQEIL